LDVSDLQHRIDLALGARGLVYWRVRVGSVELLPPPLVEAVGLSAGDSLPSGYAPTEQVYRYRVFVPHSTLAAAGRHPLVARPSLDPGGGNGGGHRGAGGVPGRATEVRSG
jgi:hypothetical protein